MTKDRLEQYVYLKQEMIKLETQINEIENRLRKIVAEGPVIDTVRGGEGNQQHYKIEGFPQTEYERVRTQLMARKLSLLTMQQRDEEELKEIEKFMFGLNDAMARLIIQYRIIDRLEWQDVARKLGGGNTPDSVRMQYNRFFTKK